jgi:hypothetical protein
VMGLATFAALRLLDERPDDGSPLSVVRTGTLVEEAVVGSPVASEGSNPPSPHSSAGGDPSAPQRTQPPAERTS